MFLLLLEQLLVKMHRLGVKKMVDENNKKMKKTMQLKRQGAGAKCLEQQEQNAERGRSNSWKEAVAK